jgi:hypothetical protein
MEELEAYLEHRRETLPVHPRVAAFLAEPATSHLPAAEWARLGLAARPAFVVARKAARWAAARVASGRT